MIQKKIHINVNVYLGAILTGFSGFFFYEATRIRNKGSAQFPKVVLGAFLLLSIFLLALGICKTVKNSINGNIKIDWKNQTLKSHIVYALIILFVVLMKFIGFFPAMIIWAPLFMLFYGIRNIRILILVTLSLAAFIYVLFVMQLGVQFP
jgi:hypothetical protein